MKINIQYVYLLITFYIAEVIFSQRGRGQEHSSNDFTNISVNRTINLANDIIHITSEILIKSMKVDPVYSYRLPVLKNSSKYLINIVTQFKSTSGDDEGNIIKLRVTKQSHQSDDQFDFYEVDFRSEPMNYEEERVLIVKEDYFERLQLLPQKISLKEDQLVIFSDTVNWPSYYQTKEQKTTVILPTERTDLM